MTRECCRTHSNSASSPLYQYRPTPHVAPDMDSAMRRDAGYPQTSALLRRHVVGQKSNMIERNHGKFCGSAERPIRLRAVTPHWPTHPIGRYSFTHLIDAPCAIAMRNDPRIRHAVPEGILTLFDVAR